jgi:hypothetical protein
MWQAMEKKQRQEGAANLSNYEKQYLMVKKA